MFAGDKDSCGPRLVFILIDGFSIEYGGGRGDAESSTIVCREREGERGKEEGYKERKEEIQKRTRKWSR